MKYILRSETYEEVKLGTTLTYTNKEGKELEGFVQGIIWPFTNSPSNKTCGIIVSQGTVVMNEKGYLRHYAPKDINLIWYKAGPSFQEFKDSYFYVDNMNSFMEHVLGVDHEMESYNAGYVYFGQYYILVNTTRKNHEETIAKQYYLIIGNEEYQSDSLLELEHKLYIYVQGELEERV